MSKPICFVACAFERDDVDMIYSKGIRPTLLELGCRVVRVDKIDHNDEIDDKILEWLAKCDFCVADLTYARPSVYFEAGHAQGQGKHVVYTARDDHFKPNETDDFGNLRVHFDLQMKNTIKWGNSLPDFQTRLSKRLRQVILPILRAMEKTSKERQRAEEFKLLSPNLQANEIRRVAESVLKSMGFRKTDGPPQWVKVDRGATIFKLNARLPSESTNWMTFGPNLENKNRRLVIFPMLASVSSARVLSLYRSFVEIKPKVFYDESANHYLSIMDKIRSIPDFKLRLRALLNEIGFGL